MKIISDKGNTTLITYNYDHPEWMNYESMTTNVQNTGLHKNTCDKSGWHELLLSRHKYRDDLSQYLTFYRTGNCGIVPGLSQSISAAE